ncbi:cobalamin-dependent protein [Lignipirellula cremea]|uniref:B12 binding domain protein n=1 Tax=Lignipirellula cremea TaxID=2528010 RepID=A0A518DMN1_9BACT|nr:cobalamin-dependent protein [Lignipirellula cremea]QDU93096.1 B12 binding domain protein [Lignipirellula cremea]
MNRRLTPRQAALAIGVSESSVKRWCDDGAIPVEYTVGGHRRITLDALIGYVRQTQRPLLRPEVIGLPPTSGVTQWVLDRAVPRLVDLLLQGSADGCRSIVVDLYSAGKSVSEIGDQVMAPAFKQIGDRWACGEAHVYQERRGCEACLRALHTLRDLLPEPAADAPLAIGGSVAGDHYQLPNLMVEAVLREHGWQTQLLGTNLPIETLIQAVQDRRPRLFWFSLSHLENPLPFLADYRKFYEALPEETLVVLGGRALLPEIREQTPCAKHCDRLSDLSEFLKSL